MGENPTRLVIAVLVQGDLPMQNRSMFLGNISRKREETRLEGKKCMWGSSVRKRKEQMRTGKLIKKQKDFVSH